MTADQIVQLASQTGRIQLGGEMEIPTGLTCSQAYAHASRIAEECGYLVGRYRGCRSALEITGPGIPGRVILDWFDSERTGPVKVELWTPTEAYLPEFSRTNLDSVPPTGSVLIRRADTGQYATRMGVASGYTWTDNPNLAYCRPAASASEADLRGIADQCELPVELLHFEQYRGV